MFDFKTIGAGLMAVGGGTAAFSMVPEGSGAVPPGIGSSAMLVGGTATFGLGAGLMMLDGKV